MKKRIGSFLPGGRGSEPKAGRMAASGYRDRAPLSWLARQAAAGLLLSLAVAFLFYRSVWAIALAGIIVPLYVLNRRDSRDRKRTQQLKGQFISGMQMVSGSLRAGYSMENAWRKAQKELEILYGPDAEFVVGMRRMNQRLAVNEPLEQILSEFADESGVEDISRFAEVFGYAKRSGSDLAEIIRTVTERMKEKEEILSEIETAVAAKKMEQRMMNFLLPGILLFITLSSPSYVTALYHNPAGILVMSVCLGGWLGCIYWSERLMDIQV